MTSAPSADSQSSYPLLKGQKPPFEALFAQVRACSDPQAAQLAMAHLAPLMRAADPSTFHQLLHALHILFQAGYTSVFMTSVDLMRKLMNHFTALGKLLETSHSSASTESDMLYALSLIAELLKENPKFYFPFTRKFLLTLFSIDYDLLSHSPRRRDILAILAVIYENLSRQTKLVSKCKLTAQLKTSLLQHYPLVQEIFTLKLFNLTLSNLSSRGMPFTTQEFIKYGVLTSAAQFVHKYATDVAQLRTKMQACQPAYKSVIQEEEMEEDAAETPKSLEEQLKTAD